MLTLVRRSFGRLMKPFAGVALILILFEAAIIGTAASEASEGGFERLAHAVPTWIHEGLGPALTSFAGMTMLGYFDPVITLLLVQFAIYVGSEPAGDVENGVVDLVLARPLSRPIIVGRSLVLVTVVVAALIGCMAAATYISLWYFAPPNVAWPSARDVLMLMVHLAAISWGFGCIALAAGATMKRRASAIGLVALAAIGFFLVDFLVETSKRFKYLWWTTPFHYYHGSTILLGRNHAARDLSVLLGMGVIATAFAFWRFSARDV
jgi:ABC-2 type transport system permease protein